MHITIIIIVNLRTSYVKLFPCLNTGCGDGTPKHPSAIGIDDWVCLVKLLLIVEHPHVSGYPMVAIESYKHQRRHSSLLGSHTPRPRTERVV